MRTAWIFLFFSLNAFSFSQSEKENFLSEKKDNWFTGDVSSLEVKEGHDYVKAVVPYEDLAPLIEKVEDSSSAYLIREAIIRLGYDSKKELNQFIHVCKFKSPRTRGKFVAENTFKIQSKYFIDKSPEEYFLAKLKKSGTPRYYFIKDFDPLPDHFAAIEFYKPGNLKVICLAPHLSQKQAASTLVHELTHYVETELNILHSVSELTKEEGIDYVLQAPGGEKNAFHQQVQFEIEQSESASEISSLVKEWKNSIDSKGNFIDEEAFEKLILKRGYQRNLGEEFLALIKVEQKALVSVHKSLQISVNAYKNQIQRKTKIEETIRKIQTAIENNNESLITFTALEEQSKTTFESSLPTSKEKKKEIYEHYKKQTKKLRNANNQNFLNLDRARKILQDLHVSLETHKKFNLSAEELKLKLQILQNRLDTANSHFESN